MVGMRKQTPETLRNAKFATGKRFSIRSTSLEIYPGALSLKILG